MTGISLKFVGLVTSPDFADLITRIKARALWKSGRHLSKSLRWPIGGE
jgi:hypothetical protein